MSSGVFASLPHAMRICVPSSLVFPLCHVPSRSPRAHCQQKKTGSAWICWLIRNEKRGLWRTRLFTLLSVKVILWALLPVGLSSSVKAKTFINTGVRSEKPLTLCICDCKSLAIAIFVGFGKHIHWYVHHNQRCTEGRDVFANFLQRIFQPTLGALFQISFTTEICLIIDNTGNPNFTITLSRCICFVNDIERSTPATLMTTFSRSFMFRCSGFLSATFPLPSSIFRGLSALQVVHTATTLARQLPASKRTDASG